MRRVYMQYVHTLCTTVIRRHIHTNKLAAYLAAFPGYIPPSLKAAGEKKTKQKKTHKKNEVCGHVHVCTYERQLHSYITDVFILKAFRVRA